MKRYLDNVWEGAIWGGKKLLWGISELLVWGAVLLQYSAQLLLWVSSSIRRAIGEVS